MRSSRLTRLRRATANGWLGSGLANPNPDPNPNPNAAKAPYGEWLREHKIQIAPGDFSAEAAGELGNSTVQQMTAFGWSLEDLDMQVADMSNAGKETLFSLGNDAPLAVLSQNPSTTYDYFKQRFAQATQPQPPYAPPTATPPLPPTP